MVMAVSPVLVVFGSIYHWYPKITGRMYNDTMARIHFWCTFVGSYAIYYPMHYLGIQGMPRRYFSYGETEFISSTAGDLNAAISIAAIFVAVSQIFFFWNIISSLFTGEKADPNPWGATTLEWQTPQTPPGHGNFDDLPLVYRWAYDYSVPGYEQDFIPQNVSPAEAEKMAKRLEKD